MRQLTYVIFAVCGLAMGLWGLARALEAIDILHIFAKSEQTFVLTLTIVGTLGGVISWLMSTSIGEWSLNARPYSPQDATAAAGDLETLVAQLTPQLSLKSPPALCVYESSDINAFAAGPLARRSKLTVSSRLLTLSPREAEVIIAQVLAKLSSGDISALLLMHGMINVFTVFPTRMLALLLGTTLRTAEEETPSDGIENWMKIGLEVVFAPLTGLLTRQFSRGAERRADTRAAQLLGQNILATTLQTLAPIQPAAGTREMFTAPLMFGARVRSILQPLSYHSTMQARAERLLKKAR